MIGSDSGLNLHEIVIDLYKSLPLEFQAKLASVLINAADHDSS